MSGPGRPRLSQREKTSREIQRHKARLAELGVIEKEMGQEEVEALNAQIDALIAKIDSLKSEYSRIKSQKDEELKSWFDDRIKTLVNSELVELETQRRETLRTLDDRIHEASERLRGLKSEIRDQSQQRDTIIKETGDLKAMKERLESVVSENSKLRQEIENQRQQTEQSIDDYKSKLELAHREHEGLLTELKRLLPILEYCKSALAPSLTQTTPQFPSTLRFLRANLTKLVSLLKEQDSGSGNRDDSVPDKSALAVS